MKKCIFLTYFVLTSLVISSQTNNYFQYSIKDCCVEVSISSIFMTSCPSWYFQIGSSIYNSTTSPGGVINHCFTANGNYTGGIVGCGDFFAENFNITTCTSKICAKVNDPTGKCPNGVSGVTVSIKDNNGNIICTGITVNGQFCCDVASDKFPLTVCSSANCFLKDDGTLSTADLIAIQNYILGLAPPASFPSTTYPPNFMIWADANGDGKVTASDLLVLRKIKLGIDVTTNNCRVMSKKCVETIDNYPIGVFKDYSLCYSGCELISNAGNQTIEFNIYDVGDVNLSSTDNDCIKPLKDDVIDSRITKEDNSLSLFYEKESSEILIVSSMSSFLTNETQPIALMVTTISGQKVIDLNVTMINGYCKLEIPKNLPLGIYIASLKYSNKNINLKFTNY